MNYATGEGSAGHRGDLSLRSYTLDGAELGRPLTETDAEYNLYTTATRIAKAYPDTSRPAPSAVYELLRFGRVIGPDALSPPGVPHWRKVRYSATAEGWVNLNATGIHCFSDADFPQWKAWRLVADDLNADCRCDSALIKGLLTTTSSRPLKYSTPPAKMSALSKVTKAGDARQ